jgi:hypothetical protein
VVVVVAAAAIMVVVVVLVRVQNESRSMPKRLAPKNQFTKLRRAIFKFLGRL